MVSTTVKIMGKCDKIYEMLANCRMMVLALCIVMCLPVLTGCGVESDLKDIELVSAIGVDVVSVEGGLEGDVGEKSSGGENVLVTLQLLRRDKALEAQYADSYYTLQAVGENIAGAIGELYRAGAHHLNFSHTSLLVLGENAANAAVWLDNAIYAAELRPTVYPVVVRGRAADILMAGDVPQAAIYTLASIMEPMVMGDAGYAGVTLQEFVVARMQPGMSAVLPCVELVDGGKALHLEGFVAFGDDGVPDMDGLSEAGELGWLMLRRHKHLEGYVLCLESCVLGLESGAVRVRMIQGKDLRLDYQIECKVKVLDKSDKLMENAEICRFAEEYLRDALAVAVEESRKLGIDFLGVGCEVYRRVPDEWCDWWENGGNCENRANYLDWIDIDWDVDVITVE